MATDLLRTFSFRKPRRREPIIQDSPLLDLPLDIIYEIFNKLSLSAKILLSQSCRDLWYQLRSKCYTAVQNAPPHQRLKCLAKLGTILPNHRLCTGCNALRFVAPKDLPLTGFDKHHKPRLVFGSLWSRRGLLPHYSMVFRPPSPSRWNRHHLLPSCSIAVRHTILAMKCTCAKNIRKIYRALILKDFMISFPHYYSMNLQFYADALTIHGKLILRTIFDLYQGEGLLAFEALSHSSIGFCPHLWTREPATTEITENPLLAAIRLALNVNKDLDTPQARFYSCDFCPTDYSVLIFEDQATFCVWQELGSGTSPADPFWGSHTMISKESSQHNAIKSDYRHGSIRQMFTSCEIPMFYALGRKRLWL
ncbi:hypothetical protein MMC15_001329 [Xylographa vitiligo]|nr:hypothetical protein [Xylographa vitiligo]